MIEIDKEKLAGAFRHARDGMELMRFGALIGAAPSTLSRIERGRGGPSAALLLSFCAHTGRDPREFGKEVNR